jgi:hypothetical protein
VKTVHILRHGVALCGSMGSKEPQFWPEGHTWVSCTATPLGELKNSPELCPGCEEVYKVLETNNDHQ